MATGAIASIRADRGFGFIKNAPGHDSRNDLFFHRSAVAGVDFDDLVEGQAVSFEMEPDPRDASRSRATNVRLVTADSADAAD